MTPREAIAAALEECRERQAMGIDPALPDEDRNLGVARQGTVPYERCTVFRNGGVAHAVGSRGERVFRRLLGMADPVLLPGGDGGKDIELVINGRTVHVDVKLTTHPQARNLLVEEGKVKADIYVLGKVMQPTERSDAGSVLFLGWETGNIVRCLPVKTFGHGIVNHWHPIDLLRPMDHLYYLLCIDMPRDDRGPA